MPNQETSNNKPKCTEHADGTKFWCIDDQLHRTDGPAIEYVNGSKCWYVNGEPHRSDGPAIEYADGSRCWYVNGKLHRIDGPAIERADGSKRWFDNGKQVFSQYHVINMITNEVIHKTFDQEETNQVWIDYIKQKKCVWIEEISLNNEYKEGKMKMKMENNNKVSQKEHGKTIVTTEVFEEIWNKSQNLNEVVDKLSNFKTFENRERKSIRSYATVRASNIRKKNNPDLKRFQRGRPKKVRLISE